MKAIRIEEHIDKKIYQALCDGESLKFVIDDLKDGIGRFSKRKGFINVSKKYIINNWSLIEIRKKYTTYYVMHSTKRLNDVKWIIKNRHKFPALNNQKMFNLVRLKDKLTFDIS